MYLLAISGGPDSMLLLNDYKKKKVIVAHVNYNKRKDSHIDQEVVIDFCKKHNIKYEILEVQEKPTKNFQTWARNIRYDFFKKIYDKYNCSKLLMAHHKDDFIETALMQQESKREPKFFGIKQYNTINGMNIYRPFVNSYYKEDILRAMKMIDLPYVIDSSNKEPIFERNKIRIKLNSKSRKEKEDIYKWFKSANQILQKRNNKIEKKYKKWKQKEYNIAFFKDLKIYKSEIVYEMINDNFKEIKLTSGKIESIIEYLEKNNGGKKYKLNDLNFLLIEKSKVSFLSKK